MARRSMKGSEFLSAWGLAFEIFKAIVDAVLAKGGGGDDLRRVVSQKGLAVQIAEVIMASAQPVVQAVYKLTVDYGQTLARMIDAGHFDRRDLDITAERFHVAGTGKAAIKAVLVHLNKVASTDEVLAYLDQHGLRPATIAELLAFGAKFLGIQRQFPVVELGSFWVGPLDDHGVAYLGGDAGRRYLGLRWCDIDWGGNCRFLAVSK